MLDTLYYLRKDLEDGLCYLLVRYPNAERSGFTTLRDMTLDGAKLTFFMSPEQARDYLLQEGITDISAYSLVVLDESDMLPKFRIEPWPEETDDA